MAIFNGSSHRGHRHLEFSIGERIQREKVKTKLALLACCTEQTLSRAGRKGVAGSIDAPVGEELVRAVNLHIGHLEGDDLIWVCCKQKELVLLVPGLLLLLVSGHEAVPRLAVLLNLRVLDLQCSDTFQLE